MLFQVAACFLHSNYVLALVVPASLVLLLNLGVTITAVYIAHRYRNSNSNWFIPQRLSLQGRRTSWHKLKRPSGGDLAKHSPPLSSPWTHLAPCSPWCLSPCSVDQHHPQLQPGILHSSLQCPCQQGNQRPGKFFFSYYTPNLLTFLPILKSFTFR